MNEVEIKCTNCAFVKNGRCNFFKSLFYGHIVNELDCEYFRTPTGKTIKEDIGDKGQKMVYGFEMMMGAIWGNSFSIEDFLNQDSAFLDAYEAYRKSIDNTK